MVSALTLGLASARFTGTILHGLSTHTRSDFAWFRVFGLGVSRVVVWSSGLGFQGLRRAQSCLAEGLLKSFRVSVSGWFRVESRASAWILNHKA